MSMPEYTDDEVMEKNLLIAVRNCGNIDLDGGGGGTINMEDDVLPDQEGPVVRGESAENHEVDDRYLYKYEWE